MVDKITKALNKLNDSERQAIQLILENIQSGKVGGYDLKKLKGHDNIFRIRKGKIRIIYRVDEQGQTSLLTIERRSDKTYNL